MKIESRKRGSTEESMKDEGEDQAVDEGGKVLVKKQDVVEEKDGTDGKAGKDNDKG